MPFVPLFMLINNRFQNYRRLFKPRVVQLILQHIHAQLRYDPDGQIPQARFMASGLFSAEPSAYHAEDFIAGTIGNIKFELCELDVRQEAIVEGAPSVLFKGLFFYTATPEPFEGRVLIFPNEETQYHIRSIKAITRMGGFRVDMAESSFNTHYSVFADSATDVSNLLSDNLINDIASYKEKYDKRFFIAFNDGYFYLAVANPRDILEPSLWKSNVSFKLIKEFYDDLTMITSIVRDFDLDN